MKLAVHGQEDIVHKGGRLAIAYKRGPTNACESYRSLLVSSHIGKTIHRSLRQHQADLYEQYLQGQQVGGRRKIPVGFALHLTRAHLRLHLSQGHSVGIIFLDLTEAFYRVIRPMALGGELTDDAIAAMTHRLGLDEGTLHDLRQELHAPSVRPSQSSTRGTFVRFTLIPISSWEPRAIMYVPLPVRVQEIPLQMWSLDTFGLVYSKHFKSNS